MAENTQGKDDTEYVCVCGGDDAVNEVPVANLETEATSPRDQSLHFFSSERQFEDESPRHQRCVFCKGDGRDARSRELRWEDTAFP